MVRSLRPRNGRCKTDQLERTAYHEAGRAVARVFCEKAGRIKYTTIRANNDGSPGYTASYMPSNLLNDGEPQPRRGTVVDEIKCRLAGMVAMGQRGFHDPSGTDCAWDEASAVAQCHVTQDPKKVRALIQRLWRSTEDLIEENWRAVEAVAKALVDRETLTGVEVLADAWKAEGEKR